jgi:hypothetical protein
MPDHADSRRYRAITAARNALRTLTLDSGAPLTTAPPIPGTMAPATRDVDPVAGIRASRDLEQASRRLARDYVRQAREAGRTWHDIGHALELTPGRDQASQTAAELAFTYAAGEPDPDWPWRERSCTWHCPGCDQAITDTGPCNGPADGERGHARDCKRLERAIRARDAEWEAGQ